MRQVRNLMGMVSGIFKAQSILQEFKPDVVIGVGGYASFPMLSAATLGRYPRVIMEQNAIPGLANRSSAAGWILPRYRRTHAILFWQREPS